MTRYLPLSLLVFASDTQTHHIDVCLMCVFSLLVVSKSFLSNHGSFFNAACNNPFSLLYSTTTTSSWIRLEISQQCSEVTHLDIIFFFSYLISHHPLSWFSPCHFRHSWETDLASIISSCIPPPPLPLLEETSKYHKEIISFVIDWVAPHHRPRYFKVSELILGVGWVRKGGVRGGNVAPWGYCRGRAAEPLWLANKSWVRSCDGG